MTIELSEHTLPELEAMLAEVEREIAVREGLEAARVGGESAAPVAGEEPQAAVADEATVVAPEVAPEVVAEVVPAAAPIRFVHPASRALTWNGEGATPDWITAYLAHGGSWSALENAAEKLAQSHHRRSS
ncbi:H-NS family nucleoid-associated regulatory protein [Thauera sp.]|uniref:H-NS family nucleoid-associated regulatory protein n=1 Tax=Thauera sp. TaxID=1905334 RepID=UPI002B9D5545|nr:H-NS family nucleoid-associated regulatory protein [Thauera sp.]HRP25553.1 H-NS family nucleoid-associated regulatory protein [Thauera sp.]